MVGSVRGLAIFFPGSPSPRAGVEAWLAAPWPPRAHPAAPSRLPCILDCPAFGMLRKSISGFYRRDILAEDLDRRGCLTLVGWSGWPRRAEAGSSIRGPGPSRAPWRGEGGRFRCQARAAAGLRSAPVACAERWPLAGPGQGAQNGGRGGPGERAGESPAQRHRAWPSSAAGSRDPVVCRAQSWRLGFPWPLEVGGGDFAMAFPPRLVGGDASWASFWHWL